MKKLLLIYISLLLACGVSFAQEEGTELSKDDKKALKAEAKKWKKKLKSLSIEKYKGLMDNYETLRKDAPTLTAQMNALDNQAKSQEETLKAKASEIAGYEVRIKELEENCNNAGGSSSSGGEDFTKGLVFKVQVGSFRNEDLKSHTEKGTIWEEDSDGVKKYTIGYFREFQAANDFKKMLRELGVEDAWIVAYEDNQRKDINDVMDGGR